MAMVWRDFQLSTFLLGEAALLGMASLPTMMYVPPNPPSKYYRSQGTLHVLWLVTPEILQLFPLLRSQDIKVLEYQEFERRGGRGTLRCPLLPPSLPLPPIPQSRPSLHCISVFGMHSVIALHHSPWIRDVL